MTQAISSPPGHLFTIAEWLAMEQTTTDRHMYLEGRIVPIASGTGPHALIMSNIVVACGIALAGKPCRHVVQTSR